MSTFERLEHLGHAPALVNLILAEDIQGMEQALAGDWNVNQRLPLDQRTPEEDLFTPLYYAMWAGAKDSVLWLIAQGALVNEPDWPAFIGAARYMDPEVLTLMKRKGAILQRRDNNGNNAYDAVVFGKRYENLQALADLGLDPIGHGKSAFLLGIEDDDYVVVNFFLDQGLDPNYRWEYGDYGWGITPLELAVRLGDLAMVKHLLERGAEINLRNTTGMQAYHAALEEGQPEILEYLQNHPEFEPVEDKIQRQELSNFFMPRSLLRFLEDPVPELSSDGIVIRCFSLPDVYVYYLHGQYVRRLRLIRLSQQMVGVPGYFLCWETTHREIVLVEPSTETVYSVGRWWRFRRDPGAMIRRALQKKKQRLTT